ncbi:MAG: hypothetical protein H6581_30940 [Bacteroidia bacterium]|nr:hypothetical protein [Bacteroidia bacterium]
MIRPANITTTTKIQLEGGKKNKKVLALSGLGMSVLGIALDLAIGFPLFFMYFTLPGIILSIIGLTYKTHYLEIGLAGIKGHNGKRKFDLTWGMIDEVLMDDRALNISDGIQLIRFPCNLFLPADLEKAENLLNGYLPERNPQINFQGNEDQYF